MHVLLCQSSTCKWKDQIIVLCHIIPCIEGYINLLSSRYYSLCIYPPGTLFFQHKLRLACHTNYSLKKNTQRCIIGYLEQALKLLEPVSVTDYTYKGFREAKQTSSGLPRKLGSFRVQNKHMFSLIVLYCKQSIAYRLAGRVEPWKH